MEMIRYLLFVVLLFTAGPSYAQLASCQEIQNYLFEHLEQSGTLEQDEDGFIYVKIEDDFIYQLYPFIQDQEFDLPPYFDNPNSHGAHISVAYAKEARAYNLGELREIGKTVHFRIKDCEIVTPPHWEGVTEVYLLTVDAPLLHRIRRKYGLPRAKYPFHITIGVKHAKAEAA